MTDFRTVTLEDLWRDVPAARGTFDPASVAHLPDAAQRFLRHAIAPGTPHASAVRLRMDGEIKLGRKWVPFDAEQVLRRDRGLLWQAGTRGLLPIRGSDRFIDGQGMMRWKLFGLVPVITAVGPDISRAAAGRFQVELVWLPSALVGADVRWSADDATHARAAFETMGFAAEVALTIDETGRPLQVSLRRWGNPDGGAYAEVPFGVIVDAETTFGGYTIPSRVHGGWHFGTDRFETHGEFWRGALHEATFR